MTDAQLKSARLQRALGYEFSDGDLLKLALTHRSAGNRNNERLEFLGDSIVNHVIAEHLFQNFPDAREGDMSRMRAALVKGDTLAEVARELELGDYLTLGSGERKSGGHRRGSILADALEAIFGAVFLDSGFDAACQVVTRAFGDRLETLPDPDELRDPKTRLQEWLQAEGLSLPYYELVSVSGKAHRQTFEVRCVVPGTDSVADGTGTSRRTAEQQAAERMLAAIRQVLP